MYSIKKNRFRKHLAIHKSITNYFKGVSKIKHYRIGSKEYSMYCSGSGDNNSKAWSKIAYNKQPHSIYKSSCINSKNISKLR